MPSVQREIFRHGFSARQVYRLTFHQLNREDAHRAPRASKVVAAHHSIMPGNFQFREDLRIEYRGPFANEFANVRRPRQTRQRATAIRKTARNFIQRARSVYRGGVADPVRIIWMSLSPACSRLLLICREIFDAVWEFCVCACEFCAGCELAELADGFDVPAARLAQDFAVVAEWAPFERGLSHHQAAAAMASIRICGLLWPDPTGRTGKNPRSS